MSKSCNGYRLIGYPQVRSAIISIVIITLSLAILSCDVFLFPHDGRWNPLDPDNELVEVNGLALPAARNGYVSDMDERYFGDPILIADRNTAPHRDTLIQFDTTDLPEFLYSTKLELYATKASGLYSADVYLIAEPWDENTVPWGQISSPSFWDTTVPVVPVLVITGTDQYFSCDVTEYVIRIQETGRNFGFQLVSMSGHLEFNSSRAANPPRLLVWGMDIPD